MITWQRELIGTFSWTNVYGVETEVIHIWYPKPEIRWLASGINFVTDNYPYPQHSEGWQYHDFDEQDFDEIPF